MADVTGKKLVQILEHVAKKIEANKDFLCELDGIVGDGDHGVSMTIGMRGVARAVKKLPDDVLPEEVFRVAAEAYAEDVGATIGPLYETAFNAAARVSSKKNRLNSISDWLEIYNAMAESIKTLGQAELGDKTMIDSFIPAVEHLKQLSLSSDSLESALTSTGEVALSFAISTKDLIPKKGRAARLGERAAGHQDAGATSLAIVLQAFAEGVSES